MISLINQWKKQNKPLKFPATLPSGKIWPKISIITPSFNQGRYIEDTILSVLLQEYPNTEHIIVDGCSTDETLDVIRRYEKSLAIAISEPDKGQSDAINKGMRLATGDILTWLNSDDMLAPGALAAIAMAFDVHEPDMVAGVCKLFMDGRHFANHLTSCPNGPLQVRELLDMEHYWQAGMYFYQPEVLFSRKIWEKAGGYVDENLHFSMDCELFLRFSKYNAKLQVIGHPISWFRYHKAQKTNDTNASPDEFKRVCRDFANAENIDLASNTDQGPVLTGRPLNIAMVNDIGFQYGAGIAHKRLSDALTLAGHNVTHFSLGFNYNEVRIGCAKQIERVVSGIDKIQPDLVVCGNLHGFSPEADFLVKAIERWPVAFCVHDLWLLTGKCPHPFECEEYVGGCAEQCKVNTNDYPRIAKHLISETWKAKRTALINSKALLLCNSDWTLSMIKNTLKEGKNLSIKKLVMGAGMDFFKNHPKPEARDYFDLPRDKFIVLLASVNIMDISKGGREALEQLETIQDEETVIVSLGVANEEIQIKYPWLIQLGFHEEPEILCKAYAAADVHISFSSTETLGQSFFEAAACHTPSIGYRTTGIIDSVADGVTGSLVEPGGDLLEELKRLKQNGPYRTALSTWAAIHAGNSRSPYIEYHSFYQALKESGLIPMNILGRKIGFIPNMLCFPELPRPVKDVEMAPYLGTGWSTISPKGILSTSKRSHIKFSISNNPKSLEIEVSAHWSVCASLLKRLLALAFYVVIRGDSGNLLVRLKKIAMTEKKPLAVDVYLNKKKIGRFTLKSRTRILEKLKIPSSVIEKDNTLSFESNGVVILNEIGVSSECRELGFRLHKLNVS